MYMCPVATEIFIYITSGKGKKIRKHVTFREDKICVTEGEATSRDISVLRKGWFYQ